MEGVSDPDQQGEVGLLLHNGDEKNKCGTELIHLGSTWYSFVLL